MRCSLGFIENAHHLDFKNLKFGVAVTAKEQISALSLVNNGGISADNLTGNVQFVAQKAASVFVGVSAQPFVFTNSYLTVQVTSDLGMNIVTADSKIITNL